jgi:hypothetical protein
LHTLMQILENYTNCEISQKLFFKRGSRGL